MSVTRWVIASAAMLIALGAVEAENNANEISLDPLKSARTDGLKIFNSIHLPGANLAFDEALSICRPTFSFRTEYWNAHPRSCYASVRCVAFLAVEAHVVLNGEGVYYYDNIPRKWADSPILCKADPCKTKRAVPTFRNCYSYATCVDGVQIIKECPSGSRFVYNYTNEERKCEADEKCIIQRGPRTKVLSCTANKPNSASYNRTDLDLETNTTKTVQVGCPADTVFDETSKNCVCKRFHEVKCPLLLLDVDSASVDSNWNNSVQLLSMNRTSYVANNRRNQGWAYFDGLSDSRFLAPVLANNELAYDFTFQIKFMANELNELGAWLATNSYSNCASATFQIGLYNARVNATIVTTEDRRVTLLSSVLVAAEQVVDVTLTRRRGLLALSVNGKSESDSHLGLAPVKRSICNMAFGINFYGWIDKVKLIRQCQAPAETDDPSQ